MIIAISSKIELHQGLHGLISPLRLCADIAAPFFRSSLRRNYKHIQPDLIFLILHLKYATMWLMSNRWHHVSFDDWMDNDRIEKNGVL